MKKGPRLSDTGSPSIVIFINILVIFLLLGQYTLTKATEGRKEVFILVFGSREDTVHRGEKALAAGACGQPGSQEAKKEQEVAVGYKTQPQ